MNNMEKVDMHDDSKSTMTTLDALFRIYSTLHEKTDFWN